MAITIIVTNAGRAALVNAANTGTNAVTITQLGVTATAFVPAVGLVALPGEIKRIASVAGVVVANDAIHVTASDTTNAAYAMRGFGLYLNDGTLFATYGQAGPILNKTAESMMLLALDIGFADIDAELITFGETNFILPPATTEILGLVELATTVEGQAGNDPIRALTPMVGKQSVLGWLLSQDGAGSGLDADMLDGKHASDFAAAGHAHGTMAAQNADAVAITGGAISGTTLRNIAGPVGIACDAIAATTLQVRVGANRRFSIFANGADNVLGYLTDGGNWADTFLNGSLLRFGIGGAECARIDAARNFGLGTNAPATLFHMQGNSPQLRIQQSETSVTAYGVELVSGGQVDASFKSILTTGEVRLTAGRALGWGGHYAFYVDTREQMRLTSGGLGIGTTPYARLHSASSDFQNLPVAGAIGSGCSLYLTNSNKSYGLAVGTAGFGDTWMQGQRADGTGTLYNIVLNPLGGHVGIGTASPQARQDVSAENPTRGIVAVIRNPALAGQNGVQLEFTQSNVANWAIGQPAGLNAFSFFAGRSTGSDGTEVLRLTGSSLSMLGNVVWHAGNDGAGSGLDADLLDGQHGAYYLPAASYTAADVRTKLLTVDGAGTGIDADLLDGQHGAYYLPAATFSAAQVLSRLVTVDGSGSGLDADLLDGLEAAAFVKYADFTGTDGATGYRILPGPPGRPSLILQWGTYTVGSNSATSPSFPTGFPTACVWADCNGGRAIADTQNNNPFVSGHNQYGLTIYSSTNSTVSGTWFAIGY